MIKPKGLYILAKANLEGCYNDKTRAAIHELINIPDTCYSAAEVTAAPAMLRDVEIIMSSWGGPHMDASFLDNAPKLRAVFYAAGSIRQVVSESFWDRGLTICSAWGANGIPVAEYTLSQILWCLKLGHQYQRRIRSREDWRKSMDVFGAYGTEVGIISLGMIGNYVCELLKNFDVHVIAHDPFVSQARARELNVELVELDELFRRAAVVSLHTPNLPETRGMIQGRHFELMRENASFINTARGAVVDEASVVPVLEKRQDLQAILDVTFPEPPVEGSPLYRLENVILTPHIAGSMNQECQRMGAFMLDELHRYLKGEHLRWQVTREKAAIMA